MNYKVCAKRLCKEGQKGKAIFMNFKRFNRLYARMEYDEIKGKDGRGYRNMA